VARGLKAALGLIVIAWPLALALDGPGTNAAASLTAEPFRSPPLFVRNAGQVDGWVAYYLAGRDKSVFFGPDGVFIVITERNGSRNGSRDAGGAERPARRWTVGLTFEGKAPGAAPVGEGPTPAVFSYFKGKPEEWVAGAETFSRVAYRDLWPGIDLIYTGAADRLKYDLVVQPGADPSRIRFTCEGATSVSIDERGRLEIVTPAGTFHDDAPAAFQVKAGRITDVPAAFVVEERPGDGTGMRSWTYGFALGDHDPALPLVLDPAILVYCGFIGGYANDQGAAIARDASGNVYIAGRTESVNFPAAVGPDLTFNSTLGGTDAFVAKVNASGTGLVYCGFIGGASADAGTGIAVDAQGNAYVAGWTRSADFPALVGPKLAPSGNPAMTSEGFLAKVNAAGTGLVYSGFIGGSSDDEVAGVAVDGASNAYVTGWTTSSDFPRLSGPDLTFNGARDAFVAKVAASGAGFLYSGFIGGSASDAGTGIAVDGSGRAVVTGYAESRPSEWFPVTVGPFLSHRGGQDAFVARVNAAGTGLDFCGYIGGSGDDLGSAIAVDPAGSAYVAGTTSSLSQFPVTVGPFLSHRGGQDAFVAKVSAAGTGLEFCGFIGGYGDDRATGIAVDPAGNVYVVGHTDSQSGFPVLRGPFLVPAGMSDAFVVTVKPGGDGLFYGGYLGGSHDDGACGVAADGLGNVWVTGSTRSADFPVAVGPFLLPGAGHGISDDAFVAMIFEKLPPAAPSGLRSSAVTVSAIDLAWTDESANEDGFEVERKSGEAANWSRLALVGAGVTAYRDDGLPEATAYFYRVRAYNDIGESAYSAEAVLTTLAAAPTDLTATAINSRRIDLAWTDRSSGETGFKIERRTAPADPWSQAGTTAANITAFQDRQVREETTYFYRVLAYNDGGDSDPSNVASATTPVLTIPAAPSDLQAVAASPFAVDLAWADNSYDEDGFQIERRTGAGGTWAQVAAAGPDATSYRDAGLTAGTAYDYRVRATNDAGESAYSNEAGVTTPEYRPRLRVPIAGISFGNVNICSTAVQTTTLYNDGTAPLTVTAVTRTSGAGEWTYAGPATPFVVPAAESRTVAVRFAPLDAGPFDAEFTVASDDPEAPAAPFDLNGAGFLPEITLTLAAQRLTERAWIIRRDYARIEATVVKSAPFAVAAYRLFRKAGSEPYQAIAEFTEADFTAGRLVHNDAFLAAGTAYLYRMDALDCLGRTIAASSESGPPGQRAEPTRKIRTLIKRGP
jgi:hypothetical protein